MHMAKMHICTHTRIFVPRAPFSTHAHACMQVERALEDMRNPKLAAARARAEEAMKKLPTTMRSSTMLSKLMEEPGLIKNILKAPSLTSATFSRNMSLAASIARTMSRASSTNSTASSNSSAASNASSAKGGKKQKKATPATDPNVAYALARGLEWPVSGSNFYNKKAKTVLQAACQPAPEVMKKRADERRAAEQAEEEARKAMQVASDDDLLPWEVNRER